MTTQVEDGLVPQFTQGDRFRKARELTGLGQREFAVELGVSQQTVTNAEKGHTKVRKITLMGWALRTGVSRHWLETGESPRQDGPDGGSELPHVDSNHEPLGYCDGAAVLTLDFGARELAA